MDLFPDDAVSEVFYGPHTGSGCRVTVIFRAMCSRNDCGEVSFPLRTDMQEARADAAEHDRVAHPES